MHESESESEVAQLCLTPSDPMVCSLPGSSVHGIFQARVLEWVAIAFSEQRPQLGEKYVWPEHLTELMTLRFRAADLPQSHCRWGTFRAITQTF